MILALDPGIDDVGFALFREGGPGVDPKGLLVGSGTFSSGTALPTPDRLRDLAAGVRRVLDEVANPALRVGETVKAAIEVPRHPGRLYEEGRGYGSARLGKDPEAAKAAKAAILAGLCLCHEAIGALTVALTVEPAADFVERIAHVEASALSKDDRRALIARFWPVYSIARQPRKSADEVDAVHLGFTLATGARLPSGRSPG